jgi:DNA sulfur modification protein DndD
MTLDFIRLENFGAYEGWQEAVLTPEEGRPVILFGGMNGGGKTTLLDAMQLALYGSRAKVSNRGRMAYRDYLRDCIHRSADPGEGAGILLRFHRTVEGVVRFFELHRSWRVGVKGIEETLRVIRDGEFDEVSTSHWDEIMEAYLPVGISNLFFFDGEQIKDLAEGGNAAAILGTAISSLLGMDLVDRLETDLLVFERKKKAEGLDPETARQLAQGQAELQALDEEQEQTAMRIGGLVNEAGQLAKDLRDKEKRFEEDGGSLFLRRKELDRQLHQLREAREAAESELRELAAGPLPLLMVLDQLELVREQAGREVEIRHNRLLNEAMEERDEGVMEILMSEKLSASALRRIAAELKADRDHQHRQASLPLLLDASPHFPAHISHLKSSVLPKAASLSRDALTRTTALAEQIARLESEIGRVPEEDRIAQAQQELDLARQAHSGKMAELDAIRLWIPIKTQTLGVAA